MSYIEFRNITKIYGDCVSCREVSLSIKKSTIHAIIGENGAGKSTLVKLLGGITPVTSGEIYLNGNRYSPNSAQDAFKNKIAFIHQHFVLAEELTALDNLILSASSNHFSLLLKNSSDVYSCAQILLQRFGWQIDLNKLVKHLSVGEQQRLEILKALMQEPDIIIFDEPTAVLTPQESDELVKFILQLKSEEKTIIIISHKLHEIQFVADEISVLRQGQLVSTHVKTEISVEEMAELMIGRRVSKNKPQSANTEDLLNIKLPNTQIELKKCEIFGVIGIEGNGQHQLIEMLLRKFKEKNISYGDITEDRIKLSVFENLDLCEHLLLKHKNKFVSNGIIDATALAAAAKKLVNDWDVRPQDIYKPLSEFSGGNQQKFVVGRELLDEPQVLLAAHPTRGVDLGAQEKIHNSLLNYAKNNNSVLLVSSDLDEALFLSDRFIILNKNKIFGPFKKNQLNEQEIGLYMAGDSQSKPNELAGEI